MATRDCIVFCTRHLYFISLYTVPSWKLALCWCLIERLAWERDVIYRHTLESQLTLAWRWELCSSFNSKSSKPAKPPMRSMVRVCLLLCCFLHTQSRKPQLFSLLPKATGWLCPAPLYQLWSGLYKEKRMAEMGASQGPCVPREPSKSLQQNPTRLVPIM